MNFAGFSLSLGARLPDSNQLLIYNSDVFSGIFSHKRAKMLDNPAIIIIHNHTSY
jgi:hypothetical protein